MFFRGEHSRRDIKILWMPLFSASAKHGAQTFGTSSTDRVYVGYQYEYRFQLGFPNEIRY